jgi:ribosomal protein L29
MKIADIRKQSTAELTKIATELRTEIVDLARRTATGDVQNVRATRSKRKELARILTVLSEQLSKESA